MLFVMMFAPDRFKEQDGSLYVLNSILLELIIVKLVYELRAKG